MKRQRKKRPRGFGTVYPRGRKWWIRRPGGKPESGGDSREEAEALLEKRMAEARVGRLMPEVGRVTYDDLEQGLVNDMRAKGRGSIGNVEKSVLPPLRAFFGEMKAHAITYDVVIGYIARRFAGKPKPAARTVQYERWALRRMFVIAARSGKVTVPEFPPVEVGDNARKVFAEPEDFERIVKHLADHAKGPARCLYLTGLRTGAALAMEWRHVDLEEQTIRLDAGPANKRKATVVPFDRIPELAALLREQREATSVLEREGGRIVPWVFHLNGEPIGSFRTTWRNAVKKAGLPGLTPHDMRRSAARNLVRAGVPERVVMDLCGWKTRTMLDRYNITGADDLRDAMGRLGEYLAARREKVAVVADL